MTDQNTTNLDIYSLPHARLEWKEQLCPYSTDLDDIYYPTSGAIQQSYNVFLRCNGVPDKWLHSSDMHTDSRFVIGELGFGAGLNFLLTLRERKKSLHAPKRLYYVSVENRPLTKQDLRKALSAFPELKEESEALLEAYPPALRGTHRLNFPAYNTTLDLLFGDAVESITNQSFTADAWYLDGFNPKLNESLWNIDLFRELKNHSHSETTFATYTSAGWVRRMLESVGCSVTKVSHPSGKRETITGKFSDAKKIESERTVNTVTIVGGGFAGISLAYALAKRGVSVCINERENDICQKASGNPRGIILPYFTRIPSLTTELYLSAYLFSLRMLKALTPEKPFLHSPGIYHFPSTDRLENLLARLKSLAIPNEIAQCIPAKEVSNDINFEVSSEAFFYPLGSWVHPRELSQHLLREESDRITVKTLTNVETLRPSEPNNLVIHASAYEAKQDPLFDALPLEPVRGQIATVKETELSNKLQRILCYDGYFLPSIDGEHLIGATYEHNSIEEEIRSEENSEMLAKLPNWLPNLTIPSQNVSSSRVAFRTSTRDRLPLLGEISDNEGQEHHFFVGFGSRGFTSIPLLAEQLACSIVQDPLPLSLPIAKALSASRFKDE